jgi:ParB-like chromosome segregation protein Spo0J
MSTVTPVRPAKKLDTETLVYLKPDEIKVVEGRNKRFDVGDITELAESIQQNGIVNPIKIRLTGNKPELVDGHRRHAAATELLSKFDEKALPKVKGRNVTDIPCRVVELENESEIIFHMLVSNDSKPFLPLEEAVMLKDLKEKYSLTTDQISKKIGKSISHVNDRLALLGAADEIRFAVQTGELKPSDAVTIVRKSHGDKVKQAEMVQRVKDEGSSVVQKELLKGRLKKEQWEAAEEAFDEFFAATMAPNTFFRKEDVRPSNVSKIIELVLKNPDLELAYQLGKVAGIGALVHLNPVEILRKINERINNSYGDFE